jgi:hypothetical protein
VLSNLNGTLDCNPTILEMKSHLNYITINQNNLIKVHISPKLNGANINKLKEQCNNNDIPNFKCDSKTQVPQCTVSPTKDTQTSKIIDKYK